MLRVHHIIFYWDHCRRRNWSRLLFYDEFLTLWLLNVSGNKKKKNVRKKKSNTCSLIEIHWKLIFTVANHFLMIKVFPCLQQKRLEERAEVRLVTSQPTIPAANQAQGSTRVRFRSLVDLMPGRERDHSHRSQSEKREEETSRKHYDDNSGSFWDSHQCITVASFIFV